MIDFLSKGFSWVATSKLQIDFASTLRMMEPPEVLVYRVLLSFSLGELCKAHIWGCV